MASGGNESHESTETRPVRKNLKSATGAVTRRGYLAAGVAGASSLAGCVGFLSEDKMNIGVVPDVDPDTAIQKNRPLADYLEEETGTKIKLRVASGYSGIVQSMASGQVHMAYFGGLSYILAHRNADARPIVVGSKGNSTKWNSQFIAHPSAGVENMDQLKAKASDLTFAFGDPISTSGTLMPIWYMRKIHDFKPRQAFKKTSYTGAHDATATAVANDSADAGSLNSRIYDSLVESGDIKPGEDVIEVWRSPGFADYPWAASPEVSDDLYSKFQTAFTKLDDENKDDILGSLAVDQFVEASHEDFEELEQAALELEFIEE